MSADLATVPLVQPLPEKRFRGIEVVPDRAQRRARPKVAYAAVVVASLGVLMLAQLALSIALSDGAYRIDALQTVQKEQARAEQLIAEDLGRLSSPQNLAVNAEALGMVQNANPVWLRMSDGAVIGTPTAANGGAGVMGDAGSKVANHLLAGVPLVTQLAAEDAGSAAAPAAEPAPIAPATPTEVDAASGAAQVPSDGRLPAPTTR